MASKDRRVFETDRKMELKLRLAVKRAVEAGTAVTSLSLDERRMPKELVSRLIAKVRTL
jgi:hypothetical protein